jgi:transcriptional regulator with XRE-family HTH domain
MEELEMKPTKRPDNPIYARMKEKGLTYESLAEKVGIPKSTLIDLVAKADGGTIKWNQFDKFLNILHELGLDMRGGEIK